MPRLDAKRSPEIAPPFEDEAREVCDRRLTGRVVLDNTSFERCVFQGAILIYQGGPPPSIRDCTFNGVSIQFDGPAGRTLALLQAMSAQSSGFRDLFKASFPRLFGH